MNPDLAGIGVFQGPEEGLIEIGPQRLELDPDLEPGQDRQGLGQGGDGFAVAERTGLDLPQGQAGDRADSGKVGIVMYYERPVGAWMDVQLDAVGSAIARLAEGLERILRSVAGCPTMGKDSGNRPGQGLDKSPNLWSFK